jgi:hypothetical protein
MTDLQKSDAAFACQKAPIFEREDWSLFRTLDGLQQRAGVPKGLLSRLVLKELADNGLDNGARVTVLPLPDKGGYSVEDNGAGIDGAPEDIARLPAQAAPWNGMAVIEAIETLCDAIRHATPEEVVAESDSAALITLARDAELGSAWLEALHALAKSAAKRTGDCQDGEVS